MTDTNKMIWHRLISALASKDFLPLLFVYLILLTASLPFKSSLWLDETVSVWISQAGSFDEVISNALYFQGQSPLYFVLLSFFQKLTTDFTILRTISYGILLLSAYVLYRIVRLELGDRVPAVVAVMSYLTMDRVIASGVSLRPYSLGLLCCFLSIYCLLRYEQGGRRYSWRIGHIVSFVLALYCHYFFAAQAVVHFAMTWRRPYRGEGAGWIEFIINHVLAFLCLIPIFNHLQVLAGRSGELTIASPPTISSLALMIFPLALTVSFLLSVVFALVFFVPRVSFDRAAWRRSGRLVVAWWLVVPVAAALMAFMGGMNIFLDRYMLWTSGGLCLAMAIFFSSLSPLALRNTAIVAFCLVVSIRTSARQWQIEDWQEAVRVLQEVTTGGETIFAYTGLIEAENPAWLKQHPRYLSAPLLVYGVTQPIRVLPSRFHTAEMKGYLNSDLLPDLQGKSEVYVVVAKKEVLTQSGDIEGIAQPLIDALSEVGRFKSETMYETTTLLIVRLHESSTSP